MEESHRPSASILQSALRRAAEIADRLYDGLALLFVCLATPAVLFLVVAMPMFLNPDEGAHLARSLQISEGDLMGKSVPMDPAVGTVWNSYAYIIFDAKARVSAQADLLAKNARWTGDIVYQEYPNVQAYPPIGYLPQALGILIGKAAGLGIVRTFQLSRLFNGLAAIGIGALALQLCRRGRMVIFTMLLFPMSLSLYASGSQDASIIALTALACAIVSCLTSDEPSDRSPWLVATLAISLLVLSLDRPPYAPLILVLLLPGVVPDAPRGPKWSLRIGLVAALVSVVFLWLAEFSLSSQAAEGLMKNPNINPSAQLAHLLTHPATVPALVAATINFNFVSFTWGCVVGCLAYGDAVYFHGYYVLATVAIALAVIVDVESDRRSKVTRSAIVAIAVAGVIAALFLAVYLIWTPVGNPVVEGLQGRYFIPVVIAAAIALPGLCRLNWFVRLLRIAVMAFPLVTLLFLPDVIIQRFFLT